VIFYVKILKFIFKRVRHRPAEMELWAHEDPLWQKFAENSSEIP